MNKQEVIEKIEKEKSNLNAWEDLTRNHALDDALAIVRKLDEPEKPVVPQFVDTWIQGCEYSGFDLYEAMTDDEMSDKVATWIVCNSETFAKAWFYGYEVEKEKLYRMRHKLTGEYLCLTLNKSFHSDDLTWYTAIKRTQKEWDDLGYWNNNLYEPEEVLND